MPSLNRTIALRRPRMLPTQSDTLVSVSRAVLASKPRSMSSGSSIDDALLVPGVGMIAPL